jgi:hypothetical protein
MANKEKYNLGCDNAIIYGKNHIKKYKYIWYKIFLAVI